jgi:hypothetical protein
LLYGNLQLRLRFLNPFLVDWRAMAVVLHEKPSQPDVVHDDIDGAEKRLRDLKGGFRKVSGRWERGQRLKTFLRGLIVPTAVVICCFGFFWWFANP